MKSILCFELKRCFGSKRLYLSLLTGIVISLLHIIFGVLPLTQWLSSWQGDFFLTPHSAYGHWIGMDSSTVWPTLLYMLLPFLCAFPFSDTVSWDFNTGYVMQIFVRRKKSTYLFAKALTIFIASAFLTATILFFDFAGTALYLPLVRPEALTNLYGISNRSLMAHLFYHKPLQYTVIYISWRMGNHCPGSIGSYKKSSAACAVSFLALPAPVFYLQLASDGFGLVVCNSVALPACGQCEMGYDCNLLLSCPHRQHDYVFLEAE